MQDMLSSLSTYGYIILFLYSLGGGMVAIIAAGVLSYTGQMNLGISIIIATISNTLGDSMLFYIGRYNKSMLMPYIKKHRRKLALSYVLMKKYGDKIIFFQKFVYGIKTLVPVAIGLTKYSYTKFNILNFISALIWAVLLGGASFLAGEFLTNLMSKISERPWIMMIFVALAFGLVALYFNRATRKKN